MGYVEPGSRDGEHLNLLGIFHYVMAGLTAICSCLPLAQLGILGVAFVGASSDPQAQGAPPPEVGFVIAVIGVGVMLVILGWAALIAYAGYCLQRRRHYIYCLVIAGLMCLNMPLGTILGIFTIVVLMRDTVRPLFDAPQPM